MRCSCYDSFSPSSLGRGEEGGVYFCHSSITHTLEWLGIFSWNSSHAKKNFVRNILTHSSLKPEISVFYDCLVSFLIFFAVIFANFFLHSINYVIKEKYILLERKIPWTMSAISETYNRTHNILELVDILPNIFFATSETKRDYYK